MGSEVSLGETAVVSKSTGFVALRSAEAAEGSKTTGSEFHRTRCRDDIRPFESRASAARSGRTSEHSSPLGQDRMLSLSPSIMCAQNENLYRLPGRLCGSWGHIATSRVNSYRARRFPWAPNAIDEFKPNGPAFSPSSRLCFRGFFDTTGA